MAWIDEVQKAINYIEDNLIKDITVEKTADYIHFSSDYFQKMFLIVTGFTVSEYIRNRRLSLAGKELADLKSKVIDTALKYGYETPESFTKAFTRFHGITPSRVCSSSNTLKCFGPLTIQINMKGGFIVSRKIIPNAEKLYEVKSENYMFPSCMRSSMSALGENAGFDFLFFAGVTGDLFTQLWLNPKWQYNDSYSNVCHDTQTPIKAAFDACGYEYDYVPKSKHQKSRAEYIKKIMESIDKGIPVLTFGIVGPPICSIIFGYDENGDVLVGWSQFTDEAKHDIPTDLIASENYFQVRKGLDRSETLIFIGKKKCGANIAGAVRASLLNIPRLAGLPATERIIYGRQAFEAWADSLLDDECFQDENMLESPLDTYGSCIVQAGTNMHYIQDYLKRATELCSDMKPRIEELQKNYQKEREALDAVIEFQGGYFFDKDRKALLNRDFRIRLADLIKKVGQCYENAAHIFM
jgi:AraC-like DNA-binding protein